MASTAAHIPNMLEAIRDGTVPGAFSPDRETFSFPRLAYTGSRGATHYWTIRVRLLSGAGDYVPIADDMLDQPAADLQGRRAEITVEAGQKGGKVRDIVPTYVSAGKNLGKRNATNALTQALRDALGLYNKQKKRADIVVDEDEGEGEGADEGEEAAVGERDDGALDGDFDSRPPPMLVKKLGDSREATLTEADFADGITLQRKLNGVHFVAFARAGPPTKGGAARARRVIFYSRTGTEFPGQGHVAAELLPMLADPPPVPPGEYGTPAMRASRPGDARVRAAYEDPTPYLDGELYLPGKSLPWISGQARRGDDEGLLQFHVFDVFFPYAKAAGHDMESRHRQAYLDAFFAKADAAGLAHPHVVRVSNTHPRSAEEMDALAKQFVREGEEGGIARKDRAGYRYSYSGYHSANLVKIKPKHDAEFPVVGYTQGTRGKDVGAVVWICEVPDPVNPRDKTFNVVPKDMTYDMRRGLFACLGQTIEGPDGPTTRFERDIKGLPLTVEYAELSAKTGKPLQAKAVAFRTYEEGPERDPIRALLAGCGLV